MTLRLGLILGAGAAALALIVGLFFWHGSAVSSYRESIIAERDREWQVKLGASVEEARREVATLERNAYERGIADAASRAVATEESAEETETVIREIRDVSPSARDCVFDAAAAAALSKLRE